MISARSKCASIPFSTFAGIILPSPHFFPACLGSFLRAGRAINNITDHKTTEGDAKPIRNYKGKGSQNYM